MCSIFYPGEIALENASCYRVIALHTRRSVLCPTEYCTTGETPRARTRAKVVISCSTFSNADHSPSPSNSPGKPSHSVFSRGECGGANTSSPAPLVTVSRLFCILVLPFYLSEGQSCHQTILSRLFMAA